MPNPALDRLSAREVMRTDLVTMSTSTPVAEVERLLSDHDVSGLPVTDHAGRIIGVVSVNDLVARYADDPDAQPRRGHAFWAMPTDDVAGADDHVRALPPEVEDTAGEMTDAESDEDDEQAALSYSLRADSPEYAVPTDSRDTAGDVMTRQVHSVDEAAPLSDVAGMMLAQGIHRVLVTREGRHVGLISTFDLLRAVAGRGRTR